MQKTRKIALAGTTLAVAIGSGYMMQSGAVPNGAGAAPKGIMELAASTNPGRVPVRPVLPDTHTAVPSEAAAALVAAKGVPVAASPAPAGTVADQAPFPERLETVAAADAEIILPVPPAALPESVPVPAPVAKADPCPVTFLAAPASGALIEITLLAPCAPSSRVMIQHGGLAFTARTSATGAIFTSLPAMEPAGRVTLRFEDGDTVAAAAETDLAGIRRFAVQWVDADAFQLQVYENGAAFGDAGHVSAATPHLPIPDAAPVGGYLTRLGDASVTLPMLAEVYTWPADASARVVVTVEAAVTQATCNREILGEAVKSHSGSIALAEITLAMPACDAIGDFLVLNNLAPETKLADAG